MKKMWIRHSLCAASLGLLAMPAATLRADEESANGQEEQRKSNIVVVKAQETESEGGSQGERIMTAWVQDDGKSSNSEANKQPIELSRDGQVIVLTKDGNTWRADASQEDELKKGVFRFELKLSEDGQVEGMEATKVGANPQGVVRFFKADSESTGDDDGDHQMHQRIFLKKQVSADDEETSASDRRFRVRVKQESNEDSAAQGDAAHEQHQFRVMVVPDGEKSSHVFRWHQADEDGSPSDGKHDSASQQEGEHSSHRVMIWKTVEDENHHPHQRVEVRVMQEGDNEDVSIVELDGDANHIEKHGNVQIIMVSPEGKQLKEIHKMLLHKTENGDDGEHVQKVIIRRSDDAKDIEAKVMEAIEVEAQELELELEFDESHEFRFQPQDEPKSEKRRVRVFMHRQDNEEASEENETEDAEFEFKVDGRVLRLKQQGESHDDKEAPSASVELNEQVLNQDGKKALAKLLENEDLPKEVRDMIKKHIGDAVQLRKISPRQSAALVVRSREGNPEMRQLHIERADGEGEPLIVGRVLGTDLEHKIVENVLQWHSKESDHDSESDSDIDDRMEEIEAKLQRLEAKIDRLLKDRDQ